MLKEKINYQSALPLGKDSIGIHRGDIYNQHNSLMLRGFKDAKNNYTINLKNGKSKEKQDNYKSVEFYRPFGVCIDHPSLILYGFICDLILQAFMLKFL